MSTREPSAISLVDNAQRSRRLRARYQERASKLRTRAKSMISGDSRQVMLGIADYFQQMADLLEKIDKTNKAIKRRDRQRRPCEFEP